MNTLNKKEIEQVSGGDWGDHGGRKGGCTGGKLTKPKPSLIKKPKTPLDFAW